MSTATPASPAVPAPRTKPSPRRTLYRGDPGMWSWVLHRITGATIFFFLFVHVLDTALVRVSPQAYNEVIETYKTPLVGLMEIGLVVAVLYHGLNGIRIILIDFWQHGPRYQRVMLWIVVGVFLAVFIPALGVIGMHMAERFLVSAPAGGSAGVPWTPHHREGRVAPVLEKEHDRPAGLDHPRAPRRPRGVPYFEKYAWLFMRFSGVALVFLALGHLFIMLMWSDGVYRIDFNYVAAALGLAVLADLGYGPAVAGDGARRQRHAHDHR